MARKTYVIDTHVLVWFLLEDNRLSGVAEQILTQAEAAEVEVMIPTLVLAELSHIAAKKKLPVTLEEFFNILENADGFKIIGFDLSILKTLLTLPNNWDIHDKIIAATACYYKVQLITADGVLQNASEVETIW